MNFFFYLGGYEGFIVAVTNGVCSDYEETFYRGGHDEPLFIGHRGGYEKSS